MYLSYKKFARLTKNTSDPFVYVQNFCEDRFNLEYIRQICQDKNNKINLFCINTNMNYSIKNEIVGILIYRIILNSKKLLRIYISVLSLENEFRDMGYGGTMIEIFIKNIKNKEKNVEIVLMSLPESVVFYKKLGFLESDNTYIKKNENIGQNIIMKKSIFFS